MQELLKKLIAHVVELSNTSKDFIHRDWFVEYHLKIIEKIALELCEKYPNADRDLVQAMVWMHDYGKIIDFANQNATTLTAGRACLTSIGFPADFVEKTFSYLEVFDKKEGLFAETVPIEIKIVSSADGAAHLVGPFFYLWWYENANKPYKELMDDNRRKIEKDWDKKIVLPEVRETFAQRRALLLEQIATLPEKFF